MLAELIGEATFRIAPLTDVDAEELVPAEGGSARSRLSRGPTADAASLADLLDRLGSLGEDLPEVAELDLNPVLAVNECVVVDARVRVRVREAAWALKSW